MSTKKKQILTVEQIEANRINARNRYRLKHNISLDACDTRGGPNNIVYGSVEEARAARRRQQREYNKIHIAKQCSTPELESEYKKKRQEYNKAYYARKKQKENYDIIKNRPKIYILVIEDEEEEIKKTCCDCSKNIIIDNICRISKNPEVWRCCDCIYQKIKMENGGWDSDEETV